MPDLVMTTLRAHADAQPVTITVQMLTDLIDGVLAEARKWVKT